MQLGSVGIAGQARFVVLNADGTVKADTGFQDNLILNQGLDFFGGGKGGAINNSCVIGSGNSVPAVTQTKLDAFIAIANGTDVTSDYSYVDEGDGLYKMWEQKKYRFTGLGDVNIGEAGLASQGTTSSNYYLTTRVLTKDGVGTPTSISLKTGETLDIYYKFHKVIDTTDKSFVINALDGDGGTVPYNVVIRPQYVGVKDKNDISAVVADRWYLSVGTADLSAITTSPTAVSSVINTISVDAYVPGQMKRILTYPLSLGDANLAIRTMSSGSGGLSFMFAPFQMRLGRVSDDAPLTKTNKDTLTIPLEFSWGRYEGAL